MSFNFRTAALAAVTAAALAPAIASAAPSTTLYGGGATFPTNAFVGPSWLTGNPPAGGANPAPSPALRLTSPADVGSHFGAYSASTSATPIGFPAGTTTRPAISYCQTGSGTGKNVLTGGAAGTTFASGTCPTYASSPTGFGAPVTEPNFAASDSPLNQTEYSAFLTNKGNTHVYPVQIPVISGAIAVVYNNTATGSNPIILTESKICQIFSGQITNWRQLGYGNKPIKVVFRSDSSGTSFSFSNHLSAVCPTAQPTSVSGFSTNQVFSSAFPAATAPAGSLPSSGNGGVANTVATTDGAIGYVEASDALYRATIPGGAQLSFAKVRLKGGINPATGRSYTARSPLALARSFRLSATPLRDRVLGANDANGRPTTVAISPAPPVAGRNCVLLAEPGSYATASLSANGDYDNYPIMAVSYLLAYGIGNGEDELNIEALMASFFGSSTAGTVKGDTDTVGPSQGFAYLSGLTNPTTLIQRCVRQ